MANYTNMVKSNHDRSEAMLNLSLTTISEMVEDGEKVTVAELVRRTGFSRDYFYKNKDVHEALTNAITFKITYIFKIGQGIFLFIKIIWIMQILCLNVKEVLIL